MEKNRLDLLSSEDGNSQMVFISIAMVLIIALPLLCFTCITQVALGQAPPPFNITVKNAIGTVCVSPASGELPNYPCKQADNDGTVTFFFTTGIIAIGEDFYVCSSNNIDKVCVTHANGPEKEPEVVDLNDVGSVRVDSQHLKGSQDWFREAVDVCIRSHIIPLDTCNQIASVDFERSGTDIVERLCNVIREHDDDNVLTPYEC